MQATRNTFKTPYVANEFGTSEFYSKEFMEAVTSRYDTVLCFGGSGHGFLPSVVHLVNPIDWVLGNHLELEIVTIEGVRLMVYPINSLLSLALKGSPVIRAISQIFSTNEDLKPLHELSDTAKYFILNPNEENKTEMIESLIKLTNLKK